MTKFVLAGGYPAKSPDGGRSFAEELVKDLDQPIHILDCLFARPEDSWQEVFDKDKLFFSTKLRDKQVMLELANPSNFIEQLGRANVIYFRGGRTKQLMNSLKECVGWQRSLEGKTVAGTSAGVNFLARYYYSLDDLEICEGFDILPIKALVHYKSDYNAPNIDWDKVYNELNNFGDRLPISAISEGRFEVIQQVVLL